MCIVPNDKKTYSVLKCSLVVFLKSKVLIKSSCIELTSLQFISLS